LADELVKAADSTSVPRLRPVVEQLALPEFRVTFGQIAVEPTQKVTTPKGVPAELATLAANTTEDPTIAGLLELVSVVVVEAAVMVSV
jgi:hypothetical protein